MNIFYLKLMQRDEFYITVDTSFFLAKHGRDTNERSFMAPGRA